jgi:hypothetical protein
MRRGSPIALRTIGPVPSKRYQEAAKEGGDPFAGDGGRARTEEATAIPEIEQV